MSVFNTTPVNSSYIKVRWQEPYTSASLNNKSFGVLPPGCYGGFLIGPGGLSGRDVIVTSGSVSGNVGSGLNNSGYVSGAFDATVGFSIAVFQDLTGFQTTVSFPVGTPDMHLDATGLDGQRVFVVLTVVYGIGQQTTSQLALVDGAYIDANPWSIVLGYVDVPSNPGTPLSSVNFGFEDPTYPRLTPLSTPSKAGLMPASAWQTLGTGNFPWSALLALGVDPLNHFNLTITPSQTVINGIRLYTYVQSAISSKFPRSATNLYNGGVNNDQLTRLNVPTGVIGGAHQVPSNLTFGIPSVSGTANAFQVGLISLDPSDNLVVNYGGIFTSVSGALLDDNLPIAGGSLLQVGAFLVSTGVSGNILPFTPPSNFTSGAPSILWRRPFLNVGGGGGGNANEILERLKSWHIGSTFEWMDSNVFSINGQSIVSGNAVFDTLNNGYKFTAPAAVFFSGNHLDPEFANTEFQDLTFVDLNIVWLQPSGVDPAPVCQISRDGGLTFETMTVNRVSSTSDTFEGTLAFSGIEPTVTQFTNPVSNANATVALNASTQKALGAKFTVVNGVVINQVVLYTNKLGSPLGNFFVSIVKDNGTGSPSLLPQDILGVSQLQAVSSAAPGNGSVTVGMPSVALGAGTFHLLVSPDSAYQASFSAGVTQLSLRNQTGATGSFIDIFNGTAWSTLSNQALTYQLNGRVLDLRVRIVSSVGTSELLGYGIAYGFQPGVVPGLFSLEIQSFDAVTNPNTFTLHNFLPDANLLKVYEVQTGQVYTYPAFALNGHNVIFPANTFNKGAGVPVTLRFDQTQGGALDNNDRNGALLAANNLGSTDPTIDRSQPGLGVILRRPDGTLRMITIDNSDNIVIKSVP